MKKQGNFSLACLHCGRIFEAKANATKYCSTECSLMERNIRAKYLLEKRIEAKFSGSDDSSIPPYVPEHIHVKYKDTNSFVDAINTRLAVLEDSVKQIRISKVEFMPMSAWIAWKKFKACLDSGTGLTEMENAELMKMADQMQDIITNIEFELKRRSDAFL